MQTLLLRQAGIFMQLGNTRITFEEDNNLLKMVLPVKRNWIALITYTVLAIVWFIGLIAFIYTLFNPPTPRGIVDLPQLLRLMWVLGVVLWVFVWVRYIGRIILRWCQHYLAKREILFINKETLIVRRPVSIFGITDAYDMRHVSAFYHNDKYDCLGFQYGNVRHVLFALSLEPAERQSLLSFLNNRFFPYADDDDNEDDE